MKGRTALSLATIIGALLISTLLADTLVRPRGWRSLAGCWLHGWIVLVIAGLVQALCGNAMVAALVALALVMLLCVASNAKRAVMGEALLFSDLSMLAAIVRHPQFYVAAVPPWQLVALLIGTTGLSALLAWQFVPGLPPHLEGLAQFLAALAILRISLALPPWRNLAPVPAAPADLLRHGMLASLLLYWWQWRRSIDPAPCTSAVLEPTTDLVVVVQCESFADPVELFGNPALAMPGLATARHMAWAHGRLMVSGFGANTMRTEYGLIFGLEEAALGFRRYDPYLTALGEASHALPARLSRIGWRSLFLHPHDMAFYRRDQIMPAAGFDELVGPAAYAPPAEGRYVSDDAIADVIMARARAATEPSFIMAVTIENHGPWPNDRAAGNARQSSAYLKLVARGDAMLTRLMGELSALQRPVVLVFYGDHRPSIPGAVEPGGDRHTPYVVLRLDANGQPIAGNSEPADLTPAQLHHLLATAITA